MPDCGIFEEAEARPQDGPEKNNKKSLSNTYAVSSGNPLKLRDLVQKFEDVSGQHISVKWGAVLTVYVKLCGLGV